MRTLLIGGPKFVGRAIIDAALAAGHELTMFNRGQTNPELYPQVEKLYGDRDGQFDALKGRTWDVVIDTSGYMPRIVRQSADLLTDSVGATLLFRPSRSTRTRRRLTKKPARCTSLKMKAWKTSPAGLTAA
jgi:nucleoside-diphosphate-sugar epimerase